MERTSVNRMVKDSGKYGKTTGWGLARVVGAKYEPYGRAPGFVQECFGCHTPMADNGFVFIRWAGAP